MTENPLDQGSPPGSKDRVDFQRFKEFFEKVIPFNLVLGLKLETVEEGRVVARMPYKDELIGDVLRPAIHGGAIAALIDATAGTAAFTPLGPEDRVSTVDMRIDYLRPAPKADLLAEAVVRRNGNRIAVVNVMVRPDQPDAEPVAEGHCVFNVRRDVGAPGLLSVPDSGEAG